MARFEKFFVVLAAVLACFVAGQESSSTFSEEEAMLFFGGDKELGTTATPYSAWLQDVSGGRTYDRAHFLPASGSARDAKKGAAIFWKIHGGNNEEESTEDFVQSLSRTSSTQPWIQFAVVVQADGWVGFGLSEAGGMLGSDMVVWDARDPTRVRDGYVVEDRYPQEDDCDDWDLINIIANDDGWIILEVARNLDTGDSQDHPIVDDSIIASAGARIISAWGDMEFGYHGNNVARSNVRLFAGAEAVAATPEAYHQHLNTTADGSFIIQSKEYTIPARETRYYQPCFTYQDILSQIPDVAEGQSVTLIGAGPVLSPETEQFVHHFVVYGSNREDACEQTSVLAAWAPGERGLELPANVGFPILGEGQPKSILIEIHYNNPELVQNQIDSSGMRFYFSFAPREFEAAFLEIGDPFIQLGGTPIPDGLTEWTFECDTACSRFALGSESVTVFQESLHMHTSGTRMVNELVRDEEVVHTSAVEVFDFDQQGSYRVPMQPYEVKPGDTFRTSCYYRDGNQFGTSSQEEMCSKSSNEAFCFAFFIVLKFQV